MDPEFSFDVFLSHSSKDKAVVRPIAERLKADGLRVWFDEWILKPGDSIPARIEEGLEHSRVLVLCMSANAFGSDWAQLEAGTFRFRDPLNKERRFIPLRLDAAPVKGSLGQFLYVDWVGKEQEQEYLKLLEACRLIVAEKIAVRENFLEWIIKIESSSSSFTYVFSADGKQVLSGDFHGKIRLSDMQTGKRLRLFEGHNAMVYDLIWSAEQRLAISASSDCTLRVWDVENGQCLQILEGHTSAVRKVIWSGDQRRALSSASDFSLRLWDVETGNCLRVFEGHESDVYSLAWAPDQNYVISGDKSIRLWDIGKGECIKELKGHTGDIKCLIWSTDQRLIISGSFDNTLRIWDLNMGTCLRVLEGHTGQVYSMAWSTDQRYLLSGASDNSVRLWEVDTGRCLLVLQGHLNAVRSIAWSSAGLRAFSGDAGGGIHIWNLSEFIIEAQAAKEFSTTLPPTSNQIQYTNAKVLLVGESGAGKTGLSKVLAGEKWEPSDSTIGAWATQWKLPVPTDGGVEKEIWLWDFGGQADQRLIHQLYMDETALAVLVFDGQKEDLFETLGQWDRDLTRASQKTFSKLLVAGRVDAGGLRAGRTQIEAFQSERGYLKLLETSAKTNHGCEELKQAILDGIQWENIPWRSSPLLFKLLKEEIVRLKDEDRVLLRFNELRETLQLRLLEKQGDDITRFSDEELKAVVGLLAGPGVVWELSFGHWVLLQPERINVYAQAVIQTIRADKHQLGCLPEERVLNGDLIYNTSLARLEADEERFVLLAMHQTLVERGLCVREHTDKGTLLIFPSYYGRERPELEGHPAVLVSYRFNGFLDDIYATLVVRLHHTRPFEQDQLWRYAADFKTLTGRQLGVKLTRRPEGAAELEVYFEPAIPVEEKIIFSKYVHEHLLQNAKDVERLRHYVCPHCGTPVGNREVAMKKLAEGKKDIVCVNCEERIVLWDELEVLFASDQTRQQVRELEQQSAIVLDNESKERALVGEVISTVALAGQISREFTVSDHGIDMEIEFKANNGEASGQKLYLQLKSGDSYLQKRKRDGKEIFTVKHERHVRYWMDQKFPVLLVIRNAEGEVRWMEVRDWLKRESDHGKKPVKQIAFEGERFDVMSVRRWRDKAGL